MSEKNQKKQTGMTKRQWKKFMAQQPGNSTKALHGSERATW
jgi:hypothetical protein